MREARARRPLVSLTPLIDVVFILLLFFMLASQFTAFRAAPVDAAMTGAAAPSASGALLVELRPEGLRFAGLAISERELSARVAALTAGNPARLVLLRPAPGVDMQRAVDSLAMLKAAGAQAVSLVAPRGSQ